MQENTSASHNAPSSNTHLSETRLGQVAQNINLLWSREWPNYLAYLQHEPLDQAGPLAGIVCESTVCLSIPGVELGGNEHIGSLSSQFVNSSDDYGVGYRASGMEG